MVNYIYNGIELAALPTVDTSTYPYALVLDISALKTDSFNYDYSVMFCSTPFLYGRGVINGVEMNTICHETNSSILVYICKANSTSWTKGSLTTDDALYEYTSVPIGSTYVWTSHNIVNKDTGEVQYVATELGQHVFAATPSISPNLDDSKEYVCYQGGYTTSFVIKASSADINSGGILTYQWYIVTDGERTMIEGANDTIYTPDISEIGTFQYYCVVTNTYEGYTAEKSSNIVTVIVYPAEYFVPKKTKFDQLSASLGWITGKVLQYIIVMDSEADEETLINGVLHLFNGDATLENNHLEVT